MIDVVHSLPGRPRRATRTADPLLPDGSVSSRSAAPGISTEEDPAISRRRAELAAADRKDRATPAVLTMENLIEFARKHPWGHATAGTDRRSRFTVYEPGDEGMADGCESSVWDAV